MNKESCFYLGYISKSRGLKGEFQIYFEFDRYQELEFDVLFIELNKKLVPFFIKSYKLQGNKTGFFSLEDLDHIDKIQGLLHQDVYMEKSKMLENDDELRLEDLKGFIVYDKTHGELGEIIEINEYPQQDIAVVRYRFKDILFPLIEAFIVHINEEEGILEVDLPEGLVDLYRE